MKGDSVIEREEEKEEEIEKGRRPSHDTDWLD
jgi:hypothetical protein